MKICYLSVASSVHTKKWCEYFLQKGYEVHVISFVPWELEGVRVHTVNMEEMVNRSSLAKLGYLFAVSRVRKLIREIKPDLVHAHYATSYGLLGALTGFHPFIVSVWGSDVFSFPKKSPLHRMMLQYVLGRADAILSTSKVMAEETALYTKREVLITPFGVDTKIFRPLATDPLSLSDPQKGEALVIGTVKRLEEIYGVDVLIHGFKLLRDRLPDRNLVLRIAGDGRLREKMVALTRQLGIAEHVQFLGYVRDREALVRTINSFDIAVIPSRQESFGVAAVEVEACGVPVVVTNVSGLLEVTVPEVTSIVVEKDSPTQIADAVERLIKDVELRRRMGENARQLVVDNYDIEDNFQKVEEIYRQFVR